MVSVEKCVLNIDTVTKYTKVVTLLQHVSLSYWYHRFRFPL